MHISDPRFDRTITLRDAYRVMESFVAEHVERGEASTIELLAYLGLTEGGAPGDPAAFDDYLAVVDRVVVRPTSA